MSCTTVFLQVPGRQQSNEEMEKGCPLLLFAAIGAISTCLSQLPDNDECEVEGNRIRDTFRTPRENVLQDYAAHRHNILH